MQKRDEVHLRMKRDTAIGKRVIRSGGNGLPKEGAIYMNR